MIIRIEYLLVKLSWRHYEMSSASQGHVSSDLGIHVWRDVWMCGIYPPKSSIKQILITKANLDWCWVRHERNNGVRWDSSIPFPSLPSCASIVFSWWRHQMETFSALLAICAGNSPVNSPHKGQWRGSLMFTLICVWINGCVNNRKAGDLRRYCTHYGVTVMWSMIQHGK